MLGGDSVNFPFAMTFILEHKKYTRTSWKKDGVISSWVYLSTGIMKTEDGGFSCHSYTPTQDDMLANDWKEVK